MWRVVLLLLVMYKFPVSANAGPQIPIVDVNGPSLIAFFGPVTEDELNKDDESNEALSDFQYYLQGARLKLEKAGVKVHELYTKSFTIKLPASATTFKPKDTEVGYYFISPGKKPKVHYGVMTDVDLLDTAAEYFGKKNRQRIDLDIRAICAAADMFKLDTGRYPAESEGLAILLPNGGGFSTPRTARPTGYLKNIPFDPWGRPYVYITVDTGCRVLTYGAEGAPGGTEEDEDVIGCD